MRILLDGRMACWTGVGRYITGLCCALPGIDGDNEYLLFLNPGEDAPRIREGKGLVKVFASILPLLGQDPEAFGRNNDVNVRRVAELDQIVTTKIGIGAHYSAIKTAAQCHASQSSGSGWLLDLFARLFRYDAFTRAFPAFEGGRLEYDLFAGLETV